MKLWKEKDSQYINTKTLKKRIVSALQRDDDKIFLLFFPYLQFYN